MDYQTKPFQAWARIPSGINRSWLQFTKHGFLEDLRVSVPWFKKKQKTNSLYTHPVRTLFACFVSAGPGWSSTPSWTSVHEDLCTGHHVVRHGAFQQEGQVWGVLSMPMGILPMNSWQMVIPQCHGPLKATWDCWVSCIWSYHWYHLIFSWGWCWRYSWYYPRIAFTWWNSQLNRCCIFIEDGNIWPTGSPMSLVALDLKQKNAHVICQKAA